MAEVLLASSLPVGAACHRNCGANQIVSEPQRLSALLRAVKLLVL